MDEPKNNIVANILCVNMNGKYIIWMMICMYISMYTHIYHMNCINIKWHPQIDRKNEQREK